MVLVLGVYAQEVVETLAKLSREADTDRSYPFRVADDLQRLFNSENLSVADSNDAMSEFRRTLNTDIYARNNFLRSYLCERYGRGNETLGVSRVISCLNRGEIGEGSEVLNFFDGLAEACLIEARNQQIYGEDWQVINEIGDLVLR